MTFEQQWIEYDYNPFVLFNSNSRIISLNAEAQFLLGCVTADELFKLATTYANVTFGFKTTFIDSGTLNQFPPVIIAKAKSVLPIPVLKAPNAP